MSREDILDWLQHARELSALTTQNGWIDNNSLHFDVINEADAETLIAVYFDEVIMEGAGCMADKVACYGRVRVLPDANDKPRAIQIV